MKETCSRGDDFASSRKIVYNALHLGEEGIGGHLQFLGVRQLDPKIRYLGMVGAEVGYHMRTWILSRVATMIVCHLEQVQ
jgi:uncharacterized membrane protein